LGGGKAIVGYFGDVQISDLGHFPDKKYVSTFQVPVDDFVLVQTLQPFQYLVCSFPDKAFLETATPLPLLLFVDLGLEVPSVRILHHYAEGVSFGDVKRAFVRNHIGHFYGCQKPDLV